MTTCLDCTNARFETATEFWVSSANAANMRKAGGSTTTAPSLHINAHRVYQDRGPLRGDTTMLLLHFIVSTSLQILLY